MPRANKWSKITPMGGESTLHRGRRGSTAITMEYPMWVMAASEFLHLTELRPHEELRAEGKIMECNPSHTVVFYISHQWTSATHPDYSTARFRAFQTLLLRMVRGNVPETAPTFVDAVRLPSNVKISTKEWQTLVKDAVIWMDYLSVRSLPFSKDKFPFFSREKYLNVLCISHADSSNPQHDA